MCRASLARSRLRVKSLRVVLRMDRSSHPSIHREQPEWMYLDRWHRQSSSTCLTRMMMIWLNLFDREHRETDRTHRRGAWGMCIVVERSSPSKEFPRRRECSTKNFLSVFCRALPKLGERTYRSCSVWHLEGKRREWNPNKYSPHWSTRDRTCRTKFFFRERFISIAEDRLPSSTNPCSSCNRNAWRYSSIVLRVIHCSTDSCREMSLEPSFRTTNWFVRERAVECSRMEIDSMERNSFLGTVRDVRKGLVDSVEHCWSAVSWCSIREFLIRLDVHLRDVPIDQGEVDHPSSSRPTDKHRQRYPNWRQSKRHSNSSRLRSIDWSLLVVTSLRNESIRVQRPSLVRPWSTHRIYPKENILDAFDERIFVLRSSGTRQRRRHSTNWRSRSQHAWQSASVGCARRYLELKKTTTTRFRSMRMRKTDQERRRVMDSNIQCVGHWSRRDVREVDTVFDRIWAEVDDVSVLSFDPSTTRDRRPDRPRSTPYTIQTSRFDCSQVLFPISPLDKAEIRSRIDLCSSLTHFIFRYLTFRCLQFFLPLLFQSLCPFVSIRRLQFTIFDPMLFRRTWTQRSKTNPQVFVLTVLMIRIVIDRDVR